MTTGQGSQRGRRKPPLSFTPVVSLITCGIIFYMKIYLENSTLGLIYEYEHKDISGAPDKKDDIKALNQLLKYKYIQFVTAADSCSELQIKCQNDPNRRDKLIKIFDRFKFINLGHRAGYRARYRYGDHINFGPKYPGVDKEISEFLQKESGSDAKEHEYDSMHLSNCYKTDVDYFLTIDRNTILKYRDKIKKKFAIKVITPVEILNIVGVQRKLNERS